MIQALGCCTKWWGVPGGSASQAVIEYTRCHYAGICRSLIHIHLLFSFIIQVVGKEIDKAHYLQQAIF